jgi:Zn-dependent protease
MTAMKSLKAFWRDQTAGLPRGGDAVWWLIGKEGAGWVQALSPFLFLLLFSACCWIPLRDAGRALSLALALTVQMFLHELGHLFVFRECRIRSRIWWLFPLGAVAAPIDKEEKAKTDLLPWDSVAWLLQAGVTMNVAAMGVGFLMQGAPVAWLSGFGANLLLAGGILAVSNLIPLWKLDGSLLFLVIFSSLKEKDDRRLALGLVAALVLAALGAVWSIGRLGSWEWILAFLRRMGWFLVFALIAAGIWHQQGMDNPAHSASALAMTRTRAVIHILFYIALLYVALRLCLGPMGLKF